ncbi:MAG: PQQ-binding-like beta-propeller repeat protein [Planctomycetes bacterium]|nr:PQQ-binding-like beta-propeller repeat protein [Planctomycetota bacterium]
MTLRAVVYLALLTGWTVSAVNIWAEDWTSLGRDASRARANTTEVLSDSFSQGWQYSISSTIVSSPAVADGFVVLADRSGYIRAVEEISGAPCWTFNTGSDVIASPAISAGRVYIPVAGGKIYCLRLSDGALLWNYNSGGTEISSPNISTGVLFMGSGFPNHRVIALNILADPPQLLWQAGLEQIVYSSPAISDDKVVIGCDSGRYYALSRTAGSEIWSYNTGGDVLLSSPLVIGNSVYLLPGGANTKFYRIDVDSTLWPGSNWAVTLTDPNQPAGTILETKLATSSPMKINDDAGLLVRFDYALDTNADDLPDQYVLNEYALAINTASRSVRWQIVLGSITTTNQNDIPSLGLCPTPASFRTASGYLLAVASSLASQLRIVDGASGSVLRTYATDAPTQSSPVVANSRILLATGNGSVYAFQNALNHAPAAPQSGFAPANDAVIYTTGVSANITISWDSALDTESASSALQYLFRMDDDGEVLENSDVELLLPAGVTAYTLTLPASQDGGIQYTYSGRALDAAGAYSGWAAPETFAVEQDLTTPAPPSNIRTSANNGYIDVYWNESNSPDVSGYYLAYKTEGGAFGTPIFVGPVTNYRITNLANGINYIFRIWASDYIGWSSTSLDISATPNYMIFLNGQPYENLFVALSVAQAADTVTLGNTTFVLDNTLFLKEGVSVKGGSPHQSILDASGITTAIQLTGPASPITGAISDLLILGALNTGIDISGAYHVAIKNIVINNCGTGIYGGNMSNINVINDTIINNFAGIYASADAVVRNNIIMNNSYGIYWGGNQSGQNKLLVSYNDVSGNMADYIYCSAGIGDISIAITFTNEAGNDFREMAGSATVDAGDPTDDYALEPSPNGSRINMGAYGNTVYATSSPTKMATGSSGDITSGSSGGSSSDIHLHCFIATAAYGSPMAPSVKVLRQFRDRYLITNPPGRWFVANYYRFSQPLAGYISKHHWAKTVTQIGLLPVIIAARFSLLPPVIILILCVLCAFVVILYRSLLFKRTPPK